VVGYFSWFDNATPGMSANIHLLNTGGTTSVGTVNLGSRAAPFTLASGASTYISFPAGTIGGPVLVAVSSGPAVLATERVQYFASFNEVWAISGALASTNSYLSWFDRASPGMSANNIHVVNPSGATANVTVSMPNYAAQTFSVAPGAQNYVTFPEGTIGGPVHIVSSQAVLASQRVAYFGTFNEVQARSSTVASTTSVFNWFDKATPGMADDNIHLVNPGSISASVTVGVPGANPITVTVAGNAQQLVTFPVGTIGGPVTVSSSQPVLASQRVQYFQSFNEVPSQSGGQAAATNHRMWFDKASAGMTGDNIHVINTSNTTADVTVTLLGATTLKFSLAPNVEGYVSFVVGSIGGPVIITSSQPVLAAQRVQYYQTFNEVSAG
jgi:hypothetical protein